MSLSPLLSLPADVLISVLIIIRPQDVLSVSQTCRVLHAFASNDYIWHQLPHDLPMEISPHCDRNNLPGVVLQAIFTRALRVEDNWRKSVSRIRKMTRIVESDTVSQMQFLGSQWLVTMRRSPSGAVISVWRIAGAEQVFRAAVVDLPSGPAIPLKFAVSMQPGCREILIAVIMSQGLETSLCVYSAALKGQDHDGIPPPRLMYSTGGRSEGLFRGVHDIIARSLFHEVHVNGHIIAVGIPKFANNVLCPAAYRILFINCLTGAQCLVDPQVSEHVAHLHLKLYSHCIVVAGVRNRTTLVVRIHDLPACMRDTPEADLKLVPILSPHSVEFLPRHIAEYETPTIPELEYSFSADSTSRSISNVSSISFHSFTTNREDYVFHFPLNHSRQEPPGNTPSFVCQFRTPSSSSAELVCLGETGRRAVWLERTWTTDEYTLMKASFSPMEGEPVVVAPLLPKHLALPFELHRCQTLAFDEPTGRVCLAMHTGELHMLEF
ncbi:hypothetical protein C8J57DRAFT_1497839 [Mycena rebaudengoi]|nr:hypothetical protein C8J57DRAFT_1497839 [Mycena rebaudengoi]